MTLTTVLLGKGRQDLPALFSTVRGSKMCFQPEDINLKGIECWQYDGFMINSELCASSVNELLQVLHVPAKLSS